MKHDQVVGTVAQYRDLIVAKFPGLLARRIDGVRFPEDEREEYAHILWLLESVEACLAAGDWDHVNRHLAFVQGVLWKNQVFTTGELRGHNRSR